MRIVLLVSLIAVSLGFFPVKAGETQLEAWQQTGQIGGPTQGIALQGGAAYLGWGPRLVIVNIANPASLSIMGRTAPFSDQVQDVAVSGNYAYVAAGAAGLRIVNISNPALPVEVGHWESAGFAESVAVSGETVYLANGPYGLRTISVTDPAQPQEVGRAYDMNYVYDVFLYGTQAHLAAGGSGLLLVDVSNPAALVELGGYDTPGYAYGVQTVGGLAYVADAWGGLQVVNIQDASHPYLYGTLAVDSWVMDLSVGGRYVYLANGGAGLRVVDIIDPAHPAARGSVSWRFGHAGGVAISGNTAYLADFYTGLRLVSISDPANPAEINRLGMFSIARQVAVLGSYAYVPSGYGGLNVVNIANPAQPYQAANYPMTGFAMCVQAVGNRLYIGTMPDGKYEGLHVLDISNPAAPVFLGAYYAHIECHDLFMVGTTAYISDSYGVHIVDFSNPAAPVLRGKTNPGEYTNGVAVSGSLAYVTVEPSRGGYAGLRVYNISNPVSPILVSSFPHNFLWDVLLSGTLAYVTLPNGFATLDISNLADIKKLSEYSASGETFDMELAGNLLYLGAGAGGIEVVNVSSSSSPSLVYRYDTAGFTHDLTFNGGLIWAADSEGGLLAINPAAGEPAAALGLASPETGNAEITPQPENQHSGLEMTWGLHSSAWDYPAQDPEEAPEQASGVPERAPYTCTVTNTANSGGGSLRGCMYSHIAGDVIVFSPVVFPPDAPATIKLTSELPSLSAGGLTIDASNAGVIIDGSGVNGVFPSGLKILSNGNVIRGLQLIKFKGSGIQIKGSNNTIGGSRLVGGGPTGQGNVLSGNGYTGLDINDPEDLVTPRGNIVQGNIIGLNAAGNAVFGSQGAGLFIRNSQYNIIGSLEPGRNNIISGNQGMGIETYGTPTTGNQFLGNYVGTDKSGSYAIGNGSAGIVIWVGSNHTLVQGNVSSGNSIGILFYDPHSDYNVLIGNKVGTNASGTALIPNRDSGIRYGLGAFSRIGGTGPGEGNIIGDALGIALWSPRRADNLVLGNQIGLNLAPPADPLYGHGISLDGAERAIVGGMTAGERNTILSDRVFSMVISSNHAVVLGNDFGLLPDGSAPLRLADTHIWVRGQRPIIQGNRMAFAIQRAVMVSDDLPATMRRNTVFDNGITGYASSQPVAVLALDGGGGNGAACPFCNIELYLDIGSQGRLYVDTLTADVLGNFNFHKYCPLTYANLTATATGPTGGTSYFSGPYAVPWSCSETRPAPTLASVNPDGAAALDPTRLLIVNGSGFSPDSQVLWNGTGIPTRYVSSTQMAAVLPSSYLLMGGTYPITVMTPAPGGGLSSAVLFTVLPPFQVFMAQVRR